MPRISEVQPPTNNPMTTVPVSTDDPLFGAVAATRLKRANYNIVIYGKNGTGKTTLASLFPKPILFTSYDPCSTGGAESIRGTPGITVLQMTSRDHALRLADRLRADQRSNWRMTPQGWQDLVIHDGRPSFVGDPFQTYVVDSCTSLQDLILKEILGLDNLPVQLKFKQVSKDQYQDRSARAKEVIQVYRDLPANTIFLALEKDFGGGNDWGGQLVGQAAPTSHFAADMGEAVVKWLQNACDYIVHLAVVPEIKVTVTEVSVMPGDPPTKTVLAQPTGRTTHRLRTIFHPNWSARFRSPVPENVPEYIECRSPQAMYDDVLRVMRGEKAINGLYPD